MVMDERPTLEADASRDARDAITAAAILSAMTAKWIRNGKFALDGREKEWIKNIHGRKGNK